MEGLSSDSFERCINSIVNTMHQILCSLACLERSLTPANNGTRSTWCLTRTRRTPESSRPWSSWHDTRVKALCGGAGSAGPTPRLPAGPCYGLVPVRVLMHLQARAMSYYFIQCAYLKGCSAEWSVEGMIGSRVTDRHCSMHEVYLL